MNYFVAGTKSRFKQGNRADASKTGRSQDGDSLA